jgi:hypothetical protein
MAHLLRSTLAKAYGKAVLTNWRKSYLSNSSTRG